MITGERTIEIDAAVERIFGVVSDAAGFPSWQDLVTEVQVLEHRPDGLPHLSRVRLDAKIRVVGAQLRYRYEPPHVVAWSSEKPSDLKALDGGFTIESLDGGGCRVHYRLAVDPGRVLGLLARGPVIDQVSARALDGTLAHLKRHLETPGGAPD